MAGWLWIILSKVKLSPVMALSIVGFVGSMTNTVLVMGSIYVLLADQYAQAKNVAISAVMGLIMGTVAFNGIPEALLAMVLVAAIGMALLKVFKPKA